MGVGLAHPVRRRDQPATGRQLTTGPTGPDRGHQWKCRADRRVARALNPAPSPKSIGRQARINAGGSGLSRLATAAAPITDPDNQQRDSGEERTPGATVEIDLRGIVLEGMDLSHAKLSHLKMPKAWLESADLSDARMEHVDLTGAHLEYARLEQTVLNNATLAGARMNTKKATNAHFVDADLKGAHLEGAELVGSDLTRAKLLGAQVDRYTSFISAILKDADFSGVEVRRLDLAGVDYSKAKNFELNPEKNPHQTDEEPATAGDDEQPGREGSVR
ncbi:MAG: pentapeptide repeat-containing protein [Rhodococcus sp. (in: high G+C Gram-positive bacteria)]|uniref:pentapeptide repeat-containing protein n=1 Tax=Rhodococcus sp. TaxID=1831 RepID=UPI003BB6BB44